MEMKGHTKKTDLTNCCLSLIKQSYRIRDNLKNELLAKSGKNPSLFYDQQLVRPVSIRKKFLYPPPEVQKEILHRPATLREEDFLSILDVIRKTGDVFEMTPGIFNIHSTEELRNIIVCNLNINFAGNTADKLFQPLGRTGFHLKADNREVFISRCEIWKSAEITNSCIDCILKSDSCPECKAAIIIFNKTESCIKKVIEQVQKTITLHPNLLSLAKTDQENEWRVTMRGGSEKPSKIKIHILVYNLYKTDSRICHQLTEHEKRFFALSW